MASVPIQGTPRSLLEMQFVPGLYPCETCGDRQPLEWHTGGSGSVWILRATCPRCSTERPFVFNCDRNLAEVERPYLQLGGDEPSQILDPHTLVAEIDRLAPVVALAPEVPAEPEWSGWDHLDRLRTMLNELEKFIPDSASSVPASAHGDARGAADQRARPERYTRAWIAQERARCNALARRIENDARRRVAEAERVAAADPALSRSVQPRGRLDRQALEEHCRWVGRDRTGGGRLDVVGCDAREVRLDGCEITSCRLEGVRLSRADLSFAHFDGAELIDVDFSQSRLGSASLAGATMRYCTLDGSLLGLADLDHARVTGCSLKRAWMDRSTWKDAVVDATNLRDVTLRDTLFDRARFSDCDFRNASLARKEARVPATAGGHCSKGATSALPTSAAATSRATFIRCAFARAHGAPAIVAGWTVVDADFSEARDGGALGDADDLLAQLHGQRVVATTPSRLDRELREHRQRLAQEVAEAERAAVSSGKERFDLSRLEVLLGEEPGSRAERSDSLRRQYYIVHTRTRTLADYAELREMEVWAADGPCGRWSP